MFQAIGGALLMANSAAIITDAFPAEQLGLALGTNMVAAILGSFLGIVVGGLLAQVGWRWVFLANVPIGVHCGRRGPARGRDAHSAGDCVKAGTRGQGLGVKGGLEAVRNLR